MNNRAVTISVLMALVAVFFIQSYVSSIEETAAKRFGSEVMVVKAKRDIPEMETINETMLELSAVPQTFLEPNALSFPKQADDKSVQQNLRSLAGSIAILPLKKGEQITWNKISEPSIRTGLAPQIAPGKRAVAIPVNEYSGVGKLVKPGDRVDVIAIIDSGGGKLNRVAKTVLQDVVVLAVGKNVTNNVARVIEWDQFSKKDRVKSLAQDYSFTSVTLEVDLAQAQSIAIIQANTDIPMTLALRNNDDTDRSQIGSTMVSDVVGGDSARINRGTASAPNQNPFLKR